MLAFPKLFSFKVKSWNFNCVRVSKKFSVSNFVPVSKIYPELEIRSGCREKWSSIFYVQYFSFSFSFLKICFDFLFETFYKGCLYGHEEGKYDTD